MDTVHTCCTVHAISIVSSGFVAFHMIATNDGSTRCASRSIRAYRFCRNDADPFRARKECSQARFNVHAASAFAGRARTSTPALVLGGKNSSETIGLAEPRTVANLRRTMPFGGLATMLWRCGGSPFKQARWPARCWRCARHGARRRHTRAARECTHRRRSGHSAIGSWRTEHCAHSGEPLPPLQTWWRQQRQVVPMAYCEGPAAP